MPAGEQGQPRDRILVDPDQPCGLADATTLPTAHMLTMSGRPAVNLANSASAVAANLALNLVLIPRLGLHGASISWSMVLIGLANLYALRRRLVTA